MAPLVILYAGALLLDVTSARTNPSEYSPTTTVQQPKKLTAQEMQTKISIEALYNAINKARVANNLSPYSHNQLLDKSSSLKCADMVAGQYYGHENPTTLKRGGSYVNTQYGYHDGSSENLNLGYFNTASDVVDSWMGSESHRASIIDPQFTEIGFATCILPQSPDLLAIVQHKVNPIDEPTVQNVYQQSPQTYRESSLPAQTNCSYTQPKTVAGIDFDGRATCYTN